MASKFPCTNFSECPDAATPVTNFSSEAPDKPVFFSTGSGFTLLNGPGGFSPGQNFNSICNTMFGPITLTSTVSQQDADSLVQQFGQLCNSPCIRGFTPNNNCNVVPINNTISPINNSNHTPRHRFTSQAQSCSVVCFDGTIYSISVPAGLFYAASQASANASAKSYCNHVANVNEVCIGDFPDVCFGAEIHVVLGDPDLTSIGITAGTLPPGFTADFSVTGLITITGAPTLAGIFAFTVTGHDAAGGTAVNSYLVQVFQILPATLPDFTMGTPYSEFLVTDITDPTWEITAGMLPEGLNLDPVSGEISGTPTDTQSETFTVTATGNEISCDQTYTLETIACVDWASMAWDAPVLPGWLQSINASGASVDLFADGDPNGSSSGVGWIHGQTLYTGLGCTATLTLQVTLNTGPTGVFGTGDMQVLQDGVEIFSLSGNYNSNFPIGVGLIPPANGHVGTKTYQIPIGPGSNSVIEINSDIFADGGTGLGDQASMAFNFKLS